jgi:hypothetical protein
MAGYEERVMAKIITATIDPENGEVEVDLAGYKGKGCHAIQEAFSKALGGKTIVDTKKPEFNATVTSATCIKR